MLRQGGQRRWGGGGRQDKKGKNSLPQLADLGNPAISQQPESRSRWAMSLTSLIPSLPIHLSALLSPLLSFSRWVGFYLFLSFSLAPLFPLTTFLVFLSPSLKLLFSLLSLSLDVRNCLTAAPARLQPPVGSFHISRSDAKWLASDLEMWFLCGGVRANMQTAPGTLLDLIRMHAADWTEE